MQIFKEIIIAILKYDFNKLNNNKFSWIIYIIIFLIVFLENGFLLAAFLPGDTLIFLSGTLALKKILSFYLSFFLLIIAASFGYWIGFIQGKYIKKKQLIKKIINKIPYKYYKKTNKLFEKNGLYALIIGRFIVFSRTILPILAGLSNLNQKNFQIFNWISSFLWIGSIFTLSYIVNQLPIIKTYEKTFINCLFLFPIILFITGLIVFLIIFIKNKIYK